MTNLSEVALYEFRHRRVLVVGDLMLDRYIRGTAKRLSPEAPVPVLPSASRHDNLGGAANVALNIVSMGGSCDLAGFIGFDEPGTRIRELCASAGIGTDGVIAHGTEPTTLKTRILSGNHQLLRIDDEVCYERSEEAYDLLYRAVESRIVNARPDAIVVSDYAKGVAGRDLAVKIVALAHRHGIPVYIDPKGTDYAKYSGATLIKPNRTEMTEYARRWGWPVDDLTAAAIELRKAANLKYVALTLGDQGVVLVSEDGVKKIPTRAREVFDVTGAGDTIMAGFVLSSACGLSPEESANMANHAAAIAVAHVGSYAVPAGELVQALKAEYSGPSDRKVYDLQALLAKVELWRAAGRRIVFTNGCFDLIHAGHTLLLQEARAMGDCLILGLNSDGSITRLKGPNRPIMPLNMRAAVLGALEAVDAIVVYEEDTPLSLVEAIRPDVLVKGGDYDRKSIVGADVVEQFGGRVEVVPITVDISTSKLAAALQSL